MSAKSGRATKLRRIQDLFIEGKVVELTGHDGSTVQVFVAKPSAFERDEAGADGRSARARAVIAFDRDEDQQIVVDARLAELKQSEKIEQLLGSKSNEFFLKAMDEIRADKAWEERLVALDRGYALLDEGPADPEDEDERSRLAAERETLHQLNLEYQERVQELVVSYGKDFGEDLAHRGVVDEEYRKAHREMVGTSAFLEARRLTELHFAVRDCEGVRDETKPGGWDHSRCNGHLLKLAEHRHEVRTFPDALLVAAREALEDLSMPPQDAAFSDAPRSSSASLEQPAEEEDSTASTQAVTSPEPVGT